MTKLIFKNLSDGTTAEVDGHDALLIPFPPSVIMRDGRPWLRKPGQVLTPAIDRLIYQEATCSNMDRLAQTHPREEDCENCEQENRNLRALVARVSLAARDTSATGTGLLNLIAETLEQPMTIEDGGVTSISEEEEREATRELMAAAGKLAEVADGLAENPDDNWQAARVSEQCRTVRDKVQEVDAVLGPSLHDARRTT